MNDKKPFKSKTAWPTKAVMEQVYEMKLWGDGSTAFYSGEGSHLPALVNPYVNAIRDFLMSFDEPLVVCDLGCGDFNVGKQLVNHTKKYIGIDIVQDLITYNTSQFKSENVAFHCLDIAMDDLPQGDCALVRQVLQHLSNAEVQIIINKLTQYKYIIITEHIPEGDFIPNLDIIAGQGTRLKKGSGVDVLIAPFQFEVKETKLLTSIKLKEVEGIVVTTLYTL